jgi:hypothetical protein
MPVVVPWTLKRVPNEYTSIPRKFWRARMPEIAMAVSVRQSMQSSMPFQQEADSACKTNRKRRILSSCVLVRDN